MKVQLIRSPPENADRQTGIGYYSDYIESLLRDSGADCEVVHFKVARAQNMRTFFRNTVLPLLKVCKGSKKADIVHGVAEHCSLLFPFIRSRKVLTFHHVEKLNSPNVIWNLIYNFSVFTARHFTDEFIAISTQTKHDMVRVLGIPEERITVVNHPPKLAMYKKDIEKEDLVLFVGILCKRKRPCLAVDAFSHMLKHDALKGYRMIFCGNGSAKPDVKKRIHECGLDGSIDIISNISEDELRDLYNRCRILLNTSSLEGLGLTTLESQRCGTPVLYFRDANIPTEVVAAAVPCEDAEDMARQALRILTDEMEMGRLAKSSMEHANDFGRDCPEKMEKVYGKLL